MKNLFFISVLFMTHQFVVGQNQMIIKGRTYDISTNEPMPYVNISIQSIRTGVISNEFGEFVYHIPENLKNKIIQISFIGYETNYMKTDTLKSNTIYMIGMKPKTIEIDEVEIIGEVLITAVRVVKKAIRNISDNYPRESFQLHGYYRDYIRDLSSNDYNNLTEAAVIIEDNGYNTNDFKKTKIKVEQIRYNPLIVSDTSLNKGYDGTVKYIPNAKIGELNDLALLLFHNPIRNYRIMTFSFVDYFNVSFTQNHEFHFQSIIKNDSSEIYEIKFETQRLLGMTLDQEYRVEGTIHIKSDDYAILKFSYIVYRKSPSFTGKFFDLLLEYKKYSDKYYLNYISLSNYFEYSTKTFGMYQAKVDHLFQYRELFINKIVPNIVKPVSEEETISKKVMLMSNKIPVDSGFWNNYNFIINEKLID